MKKTPQKPPAVGLVIPLAHPIRRFDVQTQTDAEPIRAVKLLRRPRLGDLKAMDGLSEVDAFSAVLPRITDLPEAFVDELDAEDAVTLMAAVAPFFSTLSAPAPASSGGAAGTR